MKFGITQAFTCSYLPERDEQLLVYAEQSHQQSLRYGQLIQVGFRRSGEQIYRPHCPECNACQSIRIPVAEFVPSRSQKRILKRNAHLRTQMVTKPSQQYYPLYEQYICARHKEGSMYPPNQTQFEHFVLCEWKDPGFIEAYDGDKLVAVAVTDIIDNGASHRALSALYTFFDPDYAGASLGTWMIMMQARHAEMQNREYLYLGYFVAGCQKMSYKRQFFPYEQFNGSKWQRFCKNPA